jgi:hypothetical protein
MITLGRHCGNIPKHRVSCMLDSALQNTRPVGKILPCICWCFSWIILETNMLHIQDCSRRRPNAVFCSITQYIETSHCYTSLSMPSMTCVWSYALVASMTDISVLNPWRTRLCPKQAAVAWRHLVLYCGCYRTSQPTFCRQFTVHESYFPIHYQNLREPSADCFVRCEIPWYKQNR